MGTKNNPGDYDCYANAHPDEPIFVLLGRDPRAPVRVDDWANESERGGTKPAKVAEARACAVAMREWQRVHPHTSSDGYQPTTSTEHLPPVVTADPAQMPPPKDADLASFAPPQPPEDEEQRRERRAREEALRLAPLLSLPVLRFALAMQERLDANAHKGGWESCDSVYLVDRLRQETRELVKVLSSSLVPSLRVRREAADVANFAMMVAENYGDLDTFDVEAEIGAAMARAGAGGAPRRTSASPTPETRSLTPERAREITVACVANAMSRNIPGATYQTLPAVSLEEMLVANRLCAEDKGYGGMTVDPRGLAAAFAFEQFGQDAERLLNAAGLTMEPDEDGD